MSYNEITSYPQGIQTLTNLKLLDLSSNLLTSIPENALENLTNLEVLNLSKNLFTSWISLHPNYLLRPATALRVLNLSQNKFNTMGDLSSNEMFISATLDTLILENCDILTIHGKSPLGGLTAIRILKLAHNPIRRMQNLVSPTLKSLDASHGQLTYLHNNDLRYLQSLVHLQISHNSRLVLSSAGTSLRSDSLRSLDVSYCNLMQHSLGGFPNLRKVVLSHNVIRFLNSYEFVNNTKLEYLDLSNNNIGSLRTDTFSGLKILKYLDLSWNEIANFPEESLLKLPSLNQINLSRNYLTRTGHLKSNSVNNIDMSSCEIHMVGKDSFEGLPALVEINLSRNMISHIPDSISSQTLRTLNLNYNRISSVSNYTFFMLPRLTVLSIIGNRFTTVWNKSYFKDNPYLEKIELDDNTWRCDCSDEMYQFYDFVTLEPNKEELYNLRCSSPKSVVDYTWVEACYFIWYPNEQPSNMNTLTWFIVFMIIGLLLCFILVTAIRKSMKRRLASIQADRVRQVEEARERLLQLRLRAEQEAQCNAPDPRDLIMPPSYDEALTMPKLSASSHSLCETGTGKSRRRRGRRKTKSSGDILEDTERNGDVVITDDLEMTEPNDRNRRSRGRRSRYGSHDIAELDHSPGSRRRRMSTYTVVPTDDSDGVTIEVEAVVEGPLRIRNRRNSYDEATRESDF